jgi:hypothetical protein
MTLDDLRPNEDYAALLRKESRVYKRLILSRWAALNYQWRAVKFERVEFSAQAIFYKIATQRKSILYPLTGVIWNALPQGVRVGDLVRESVLFELSCMIQRRVSAKYNADGVWIIVHREDMNPDSFLLPEVELP